jgi:hypothetical protein
MAEKTGPESRIRCPGGKQHGNQKNCRMVHCPYNPDDELIDDIAAYFKVPGSELTGEKQ